MSFRFYLSDEQIKNLIDFAFEERPYKVQELLIKIQKEQKL